MADVALENRIFAVYRGSGGSPPLPRLCRDLLAGQMAVWPQLASAYADLGGVQVREVSGGVSPFRLQFNPRRMVSSTARVDAEAIGRRRCFLCPPNLIPVQQGICYRREYLILCNPAPIFPFHYTVSAVRHLPQSLEENLSVLLHLAEDLSGAYTVFYNGPRCGASAPDHFHFQMAPSRSLPIEGVLGGRRGRTLVKRRRSLSLFQLADTGRAILLVEGTERRSIEIFLKELLLETKRILGEAEEPMMNLLCAHRGGRWRVTIFLRSKHRPDDYYRKGEAQLLISPGAVDMGGLIVLPREKDFTALTPDRVRDILREVSLGDASWKRLLAALSVRMQG